MVSVIYRTKVVNCKQISLVKENLSRHICVVGKQQISKIFEVGNLVSIINSDSRHMVSVRPMCKVFKDRYVTTSYLSQLIRGVWENCDLVKIYKPIINFKIVAIIPLLS